MTDPAALQDLLRRRLALVGRLAEATADAQKLGQRIGGLDMDRLRFEMDAAGGRGPGGTVRRDTEDAIAAAEAELDRCRRRIDALEAEIAELIAAIAGR